MFKNAKSFLIKMEKKLKQNPKKNVRLALERATNEVRNQAVQSIMTGAGTDHGQKIAFCVGAKVLVSVCAGRESHNRPRMEFCNYDLYGHREI